MRISKREIILEAATRCIAEDGIEATTTRRIAERAGVSRGLVPYYIPRRKDLLSAVVLYLFDKLRTDARQTVSNQTGLEWLVNVYRINFEFFLRNKHYYASFLLSYYYAGYDKKFLKLHTEQHLYNTGRCAEMLRAELQKRGVVRSPEAIALKSEEVLERIDGALLFFSATKPRQSEEDFIEQRVTAFRADLEAFFSPS
ncbi:TetR/AcrR family transcriptional regulator [bacterium]|nr:TetR/AcrR family transcriptional regulator [bacterium]